MTRSLREQLDVGTHELISLVGAGGKSTILFSLGRDLAVGGGRVILTTTTRMASDQVTEPVCWAIDTDTIERAFVRDLPLFVATGAIPGKITGPRPDDVDYLFGATTADHVIVEADGARSMSVKAPAAHEPAIPSRSTLVIVVAGIDAVGHPIHDVAHRPERVATLAGRPEDAVLTVADLAAVLLHPDGGLKRIPDSARVAVAITKTTPETDAAATELAARVAAHPRVERTLTLPFAER